MVLFGICYGMGVESAISNIFNYCMRLASTNNRRPEDIPN